MGIFTRFRDIVSSNINAMLDSAEDPEKLIKLMIREMEDTLIEIKASCAGVMAERKKEQRQLEEIEARAKHWGEKAELAVRKGRDDLAREALLQKRSYMSRKVSFEKEVADLDHSRRIDGRNHRVGVPVSPTHLVTHSIILPYGRVQVMASTKASVSSFAGPYVTC